MIIDETVDPTIDNHRRIMSIDILKGAAIIGVVLAHLVLLPVSSDVGGGGYKIGEFFYSALLMFIVFSGYFYRPGKSVVHYYLNRVLVLVGAFLAFTVVLTAIMYLYLMMLGYDLSSSDLWGDIAIMIVGRGCFEDIYTWSLIGEKILDVYDVTHSYYFFQILIVGYVIFYPIVDWVIVNWKRLLLVMFLFTSFTALYMEIIHIQLPFYAHLAPLSASFLLFGAYLGKIKFAEILDKAYRTPRCIAIILALLALSLVMIGLFPTEMSIIYSKFGHYGGWSVYPFIVMSVSSGLVLLYGTTIVAKLPYISDGMAYFGRGSVWIFLLHMFVAKMLVAPFMKLTTDSWLPAMSMTASLILSALTITLSFAIVRICSRVSRYVGISLT